MFMWESSFISETVCRPGRASIHSPGRRFSPVLQKPAADLFCGFEQCARLDQAVKLGHLGVHVVKYPQMGERYRQVHCAIWGYLTTTVSTGGTVWRIF